MWGDKLAANSVGARDNAWLKERGLNSSRKHTPDVVFGNAGLYHGPQSTGSSRERKGALILEICLFCNQREAPSEPPALRPKI